MKNIHVLPKNIFNQIGVDHYGKTPTQIKIGEFLINKGIYITSNEEIKRYGEYYLDIDTKEIKTSFENMGKYLSNEKKIVLTDNEDLIKDGVQAIDDEFLGWFVENQSCEEIYVNKIESFDFEMDKYVYDYKIIIPKEDWLLNNPQCKQIESCSKSLSKKCICPKEEPTIEEEYLKDELKKYDGIDVVVLNKPEEPKQETLLQIANRKLMSNDWLNGAEFGAKWQQEQDIPKQGIPTEVDSILAKITHQNDLGLSQWYEVVYYDNKWCSYSGSKTFEDGERVVGWKYCKDLI